MIAKHTKEYTKCDICGDVMAERSRGFKLRIHKLGGKEVFATVLFDCRIDGVFPDMFTDTGCDVCDECIATTLLSKVYKNRDPKGSQ